MTQFVGKLRLGNCIIYKWSFVNCPVLYLSDNLLYNFNTWSLVVPRWSHSIEHALVWNQFLDCCISAMVRLVDTLNSNASSIVCCTIAISNFSVFEPGYYSVAAAHGYMGCVVTVIGFLQPINAYFRPHVEKNQPKSNKRTYWEYWHKGSGWLAIVLSIPTIIIGTNLAIADNNIDYAGPYFGLDYSSIVSLWCFRERLIGCLSWTTLSL